MATTSFNHLINIIFGVKNAQKAKAAIKGVDRATKDVGRNAAKGTSKMNDFARALRRAAIVAPVWMALRTALMSFLRGFSEGLQYLEEFNREMIKAQAVVHGVVGSMDMAMADLQTRVRELSQETGVSMTKITSAFYRFGTVGLDMETSWQGAEASVRFAVATMGDADQIAKTMALTFTLLGDTIDDTIPETERFNVQMAKMFKLWQVNAFEASQLTESLRQFLPTANTMNLTMDETIALLATLNSAALQGSRGGRLLRTSFAKLLDNTDDLATSLGIYVNPELENSFTLFMKVLGAIKELNKRENLPLEAQEAIAGIFGGIRGGEPVRALISLYDKLNENLAVTTARYNEQGQALEDYNQRLNDVTESIAIQLDIFRELRKQLFEQFITGVTGADDFGEALVKINDILREMVTISKIVGESYNELFSIPETRAEAVAKIIRQLLFPEGLDVTPTVLTNITEHYMEQSEQSEKIVQNEKEIASVVQQIAKEVEDTVAQYDKLTRSIETQSNGLLSSLAILRLQGQHFSEMDIAVARLSFQIQNIVNQFNRLDQVQSGTVQPIEQQILLTQVLSRNWAAVANTLTGLGNTEKTILALQKSLTEVEVARQKRTNELINERVNNVETIINHELELASIRGASERQLVKLEESLRRMVFGEDAVRNSLDLRLKQEQAITREKENQNKFSQESIEIFRIAKAFGTDTARNVAQVLRGWKEVSELSPRLRAIFQQFFPSRFQQFQAEEFFGTAAARGIPIRERFAPTTNLGRFQELLRLREGFEVTPEVIQNISTNIEPIQINVDIPNMIDKIVEAIKEELEKNESDLTKQINKRIEEF